MTLYAQSWPLFLQGKDLRTAHWDSVEVHLLERLERVQGQQVGHARPSQAEFAKRRQFRERFKIVDWSVV